MAAKRKVRPLDCNSRRDRAIGCRRLLKLADFLETKVPKRAFDFGEVMLVGEREPLDALASGGGCGTVGCAMGWSPAALPRVLAWSRHGAGIGVKLVGGGSDYHFSRAAAKAFALSDEEIDALFVPSFAEYIGLPAGVKQLPAMATPKQVAANIRAFVKAKRKEDSR